MDDGWILCQENYDYYCYIIGELFLRLFEHLCKVRLAYWIGKKEHQRKEKKKKKEEIERKKD